MGIDTKGLVESSLSNVSVKSYVFFQNERIVTTLSSGVETTVRIELLNPKSLALDYSVTWGDAAPFATLPQITTSQPTYVEVNFLLSAGAEHSTITIGLEKSSPSTGKTFPSDRFQIVCDSPPAPLENLTAGNDTTQRAMLAFTLPEGSTQSDLNTLELRWRDVNDTTHPGDWASSTLPVDSASLSTPGTPDLLQGIPSSKKRYFRPDVVPGRAYQFSVSLTDRLGQSSTAQTISTSTVTHTLTYSANGGSGAVPGAATLPFGTSVIVDSDNLGSSLVGPSGTVFGGWSTVAQGQGMAYTTGTTLTLESDVTLYAIWLSETLNTVTYLANGGSGPLPTPTSFAPGQSITVDPMDLGAQLTPPSGYVFADWNVEASGMGVSYSPGTVLSPGGDLVLYARWTPVSYTLSYSLNGGSGFIPQAQTALAGSSVEVDPSEVGATLTPPTGYTFNGWNTEDQGGGSQYATGATIVLNSNVILYAQWRPLNSVTVTFEPNYMQAFVFTSPPATLNFGETIVVTPGFSTGSVSEWKWYLDGAADGSAATYTATPPVGFHTLVVTAKNNGVLYSGTMTFIVVNK